MFVFHWFVMVFRGEGGGGGGSRPPPPPINRFRAHSLGKQGMRIVTLRGGPGNPEIFQNLMENLEIRWNSGSPAGPGSPKILKNLWKTLKINEKQGTPWGPSLAHRVAHEPLKKKFMSESVVFFVAHESLMNRTAAAHENFNIKKNPRPLTLACDNRKPPDSALEAPSSFSIVFQLKLN